MPRLVALTVCVAMLAACAPGGDASECRVECVSDEPGLPPNRVECRDEDGLVCAPLMGCLDGTPVSTLICRSDGPRCTDGSRPRCAPSEPPAD